VVTLNRKGHCYGPSGDEPVEPLSAVWRAEFRNPITLAAFTGLFSPTELCVALRVIGALMDAPTMVMRTPSSKQAWMEGVWDETGHCRGLMMWLADAQAKGKVLSELVVCVPSPARTRRPLS